MSSKFLRHTRPNGAAFNGDRWRGMRKIPAAHKDEFNKSFSAEYADLSKVLAEFSASNGSGLRECFWED